MELLAKGPDVLSVGIEDDHGIHRFRSRRLMGNVNLLLGIKNNAVRITPAEMLRQLSPAVEYFVRMLPRPNDRKSFARFILSMNDRRRQHSGDNRARGLNKRSTGGFHFSYPWVIWASGDDTESDNPRHTRLPGQFAGLKKGAVPGQFRLRRIIHGPISTRIANRRRDSPFLETISMEPPVCKTQVTAGKLFTSVSIARRMGPVRQHRDRK